MNTDHTFEIGKNHTVCEDYSLSGLTEDGTAYAIVCDGCSASSDVDFGARVLAYFARDALTTKYMTHWKNDYVTFGDAVITKSVDVLNNFEKIKNQVLDVTLLVAWVKDGMLTCYIYGDGLFILKGKEHTRTVHVDFSHNAPAYLSYNLDEKRKQDYIDFPGVKWVTDSDDEFPKSVKPFEPVVIKSPVDVGDIVAITSDGIGSFRKIDNENLKWNDMVSEFVGYKNLNGEFVKRRMAAFKRKCLVDGTTHSDDISVATIVV